MNRTLAASKEDQDWAGHAGLGKGLKCAYLQDMNNSLTFIVNPLTTSIR